MSFRNNPLALILIPLFAPAAFGVNVEHTSTVSCSAGPLNPSPYTDYGAINPTADTIGGGSRYSGVISGSATTVHNEAQLRSALASATASTVVYLDPTGTFNLTGTLPIWIPAGVTLASNRGAALPGGGYSEGALIAVDSGVMSAYTAVFDTSANNVRITGLRLQGPYGVIDQSIEQIEVNGLTLRGADNEVDNVDVYGFSGAGIRLQGAQRAYIHHSHVHTNHQKDFYANAISGVTGYGIGLYGDADALIEANLFDYNRHSIAGDSDAGQSYEARYNVVQQHQASHAFDMHSHQVGSNYVAGNEIYIHHNTFITTQASTGVADSRGPYNIPATGVDIRGEPTSCAWIDHNVFADKDITGTNAKVIRQENPSYTPPHYQPGSNLFDTINLLSANAVSGEWVALQQGGLTLSDMHVGDFDGDGRDDIFKVDSGYWVVSTGGNAPWQAINVDGGISFADLRFGDFDGDGITDVFYAEPIPSSSYRQWKVVLGGQGTAQNLNTSLYPLAELRFADLDHDGSTDVFHRRSTGEWEISSGGIGAWTVINTPSPSPALADLAFGDFDGDGKTDVFYASGTEWFYSSQGTGAWIKLADSAYTVADLLFGDFNGDGKTDVLSYQSGTIKVSYGANIPWQTVNKMEAGMTINTTGVADFNGDGKTELLWNGTPSVDKQCTSSGCPLW